MIHILQKLTQENNKGFTLLFAVLVSVLVLAVGASIINIALKQTILSGAGRESQFAFYAANSGLECALYWDLHGSTIVGANVQYVFPPPGGQVLANTDAVNCNGGFNIVDGTPVPSGTANFISGWVQTNPGTQTRTVFTLPVTNAINADVSDILYCAKVTVEKETQTNTSGETIVITTITSQGLNSCDPNNDPRVVERGLVLQYTS
jgi:hypothetical protein